MQICLSVNPRLRLFLFFLALLGQMACLGQPLRYTFSGQITSLDHDGAGTLSAQGTAVGDPMSVLFELDFGSAGQARCNDGTVVVIPPYTWEDLSIDYFYARMSTGTLLPSVNGGMYNGPEDAQEYLAGWNRIDATDNRGVLQGGSANSYFRLERVNLLPEDGVSDWRVQDWQVGTVVQGSVVGFSDLDYSIFRAGMRLDSITLVPEPGGFSLLLLGGLSCVIWQRRHANRLRSAEPGLG